MLCYRGHRRKRNERRHKEQGAAAAFSKETSGYPFTGIVAGNVKAFGIQQVKERGPYLIKGDRALMSELDLLLKEFVQQGRMKLRDEDYRPCFKLIA